MNGRAFIGGAVRVMVIGAHPDDADIVCGGTAVKRIKKGCKVKFVSPLPRQFQRTAAK